MVYFSFVSFLCVKPFLGKSMSSVESEHSSTRTHTHTHIHSEGKSCPCGMELKSLDSSCRIQRLVRISLNQTPVHAHMHPSVCVYLLSTCGENAHTCTHAHPSTLSLWAPGNLRILFSRNSCTKRESTQCAYRSNTTNGASFTDHLHVIDLFVVLTS